MEMEAFGSRIRELIRSGWISREQRLKCLTDLSVLVYNVLNRTAGR